VIFSINSLLTILLRLNNFHNVSPTTLISVSSIPELLRVRVTGSNPKPPPSNLFAHLLFLDLDTGVDVGAAVTIAEVRSALKDVIATHPVCRKINILT